MKSLITLGSSLMILLGNVATATADHRRQLDDMAFAVLADSRDIRWAVRDDFTQSGDLRDLCRESDDVFATARNLQDAIFRGRTLPVICNNIHNVETELCELELLLQRCDLARLTPPRFQGRQNGYSFAAGSQHAGYNQVQLLQARIDQIKQILAAMHAIIDAVNAGPGYIPQPYTIDPPLPAVPSTPGTHHHGSPTLPGPSLPAPLTRNDSPVRRYQSYQPVQDQSRPTTFSIGGLRVTLGD